jgi:isochorismate synthase
MRPEVFSSLKTSGVSYKEVIEALFITSLEQNKAIAVWRLPESAAYHAVVDLSAEALRIKAEIEKSEPGFIVSPFVNKENSHSIFIRANVFYSSLNNSLSYGEGVSENDKSIFNEMLEQSLEQPGKAASVKAEVPHLSEISRDTFTSSVSKAVNKIREGEFKKVVLARQKKVATQKPINPVELFFSLAENYNNAFVSLVAVPGIGVWIGASPELLLSVDRQKIFRTGSLAGTQIFREELKISDCVWTQKEIEEQALVSRYIINCFKAIRLREYEEEGPRTVRAGNLLHLKTDFLADMLKLGFPELGTQMLNLLHPTSAVCGMPKVEAMNFILQEEKFDRSVFSGFLGPVNIDSESSLYVNLRCARIFHQSAILFAGAGITQDSEPEKEWLETEMKMKTIGDFLITD